MLETPQTQNNQSLRIQLSLASLLFFSPFVKYLIAHNDFELSDLDRKFVSGYMRLGLVCIGLLILGISTTIFNYFFTLSILDILYTVSMSILVASLILGCIGIFTDIPLQKLQTSSQSSIHETSGITSKEVLLNYLPFFNIYRRYTLHTFDTPNLIIKESLIIWTLFGCLSLSGNITLLGILFFIILLRIITLIIAGDILPGSIPRFLNQLFTKNIEEIRGYLIGSSIFLFQHLFGTSKTTWKDTVSTSKQPYTYLYDLRKFTNIQRQYGIAIILLIGSYWQGWIDMSSPGILTALGILGGRYLFMIALWKHIPALPLLNEFTEIVTFLWKKITNK